MENVFDWHLTEDQAQDLVQAIFEFQEKLPGWWWSLGNCNYSADASGFIHMNRAACAPTIDIEYINLVVIDSRFDSGFHCDLVHPASLADSLRGVMNQALFALEESKKWKDIDELDIWSKPRLLSLKDEDGNEYFGTFEPDSFASDHDGNGVIITLQGGKKSSLYDFILFKEADEQE